MGAAPSQSPDSQPAAFPLHLLLLPQSPYSPSPTPAIGCGYACLKLDITEGLANLEDPPIKHTPGPEGGSAKSPARFYKAWQLM